MTRPEQVPDSSPEETPLEILNGVDDYQKRIELQWELAKSAYQKKINQILDEFIQQKLPNVDAAPPKIFKDFEREPAINELLARAEQTLKSAEKKVQRLTFDPSKKQSLIDIDWRPSPFRPSKSWLRTCGFAALAGGVAFAAWLFFRFPIATPLPYAHTGGLAFDGDTVIIGDWFRKVLYVHTFKKGLPLATVEPIQNEFLTGIAVSPKKIWTIDGFNHEILEHSLADHFRILQKVPTPGKAPAGLFFDGKDLWSMDDESKKLYRHRLNDLTDILEDFTLPNTGLTAFFIANKRVWILNGKAREINIYRLADPIRMLASYDLDKFLKGSNPTGLSVKGDDLWVTTENPSQLVRISKKSLKKINPDEF